MQSEIAVVSMKRSFWLMASIQVSRRMGFASGSLSGSPVKTPRTRVALIRIPARISFARSAAAVSVEK